MYAFWVYVCVWLGVSECLQSAQNRMCNANAVLPMFDTLFHNLGQINNVCFGECMGMGCVQCNHAIFMWRLFSADAEAAPAILNAHTCCIVIWFAHEIEEIHQKKFSAICRIMSRRSAAIVYSSVLSQPTANVCVRYLCSHANRWLSRPKRLSPPQSKYVQLDKFVWIT